MLYYIDKLGGQSLSCAFVHAETNVEELSAEMEKQFGISSTTFAIAAIYRDRDMIKQV